ncbi:ABC transporter permease [Anaerolineales bacterium HSG6]|nr:ABC transporter permease [Anaerolineales bacterium HSG6]MDM8531069.1 ABC transporter permease [Anaerolineales bacterium HSG25]
MANIPSSVIRVSAFLRKEIFEIMRQPMLLLTLVLGPFLILLFFGIGYRNEPLTLRTVFVVDKDSPIAKNVEEQASSLGAQLQFEGITDDLDQARQRLQNNEIDLITIVPNDPYQNLLMSQQSVFSLYHQEIDPFRTQYVDVFGRVYIDEINRRVLRRITTAGQTDLVDVQKKLDAAHSSIESLRDLYELCLRKLDDGENSDCNREVVQNHIQDIDEDLDTLELTVTEKARLVDAINEGVMDEPLSELDLDSSTSETETEANLETTLVDLVQKTNELSDLNETTTQYDEQLILLKDLEVDLNRLETKIIRFIDIDARVLITPFRAETTSLAAVIPSPADFFAPAVIVLLLQHLTVTFAALSMVRERQLGTMELFYVAPLSAFETLLGKYLSYLLFGGVLAIILLILVVFGMGVPMLGSWLSVGLTLLTLVFTSLGVGFVISLISKTDTQAVQYSMIVLLTSVFFAGFILSLEVLWEPVRLISKFLPATYGIILMRGIMLQGSALMLDQLTQLFIFGLILFILSWWMLRRSMAYV